MGKKIAVVALILGLLTAVYFGWKYYTDKKDSETKK